jgi:hypothetical protein
MAMMTKITSVMAAAAVLGVVSVAQAGQFSDDYGDYSGGYKWGPYGQRLGGTPYWRGREAAYSGFAYVPGHRRVWRHERDYR